MGGAPVNKSKISWTETTWNPIRGCRPVSSGCANCYAALVAARFSKPGQPYEGLATMDGRPRWTGESLFVDARLADPLRWTRPRMVFVNSMSDLFFEGFDFEEIAAIFGVMASAPLHTFQVLTKRPERAREWFDWYEGSSGCGASSFAAIEAAKERLGRRGFRWPKHEVQWPLRNLWLGVSVEDQARAEERIPILLDLPAHLRWISAEPLLGPVDLTRVIQRNVRVGGFLVDELSNNVLSDEDFNIWTGEMVQVPRLDWVVIGGESGSRARPFELEWCYRMVRDCVAHGVPVFVKQMGDNTRAADTSFDLRRADGRYPMFDHNRVVFGSRTELDEFPAALRFREWPRGVEP